MTVLRTTLGLTSFAKGGGAASTGLGLVSVADGGGVALDDEHPIIWLPVPNSRSRPSPLEPTAVPGVFSNLQFAESGSQEVCCRYPCPDIRVRAGAGICHCHSTCEFGVTKRLATGAATEKKKPAAGPTVPHGP